MQVSESLESCTNEAKHVSLASDSDSTSQVVLVDTPGLNHTRLGDREVLDRIINGMDT
jgi:GTPase Era involved in 16S rRNA processing